MEASIFEKMSDRIIFTIAKEVITEFDIEYAQNAGDYMFYEAVVDACKMYSIEPSIQDTDFLYNIIKLNKPMFEEGSLTSKLERPTLKNYEYEWSVTFKKIVNEYWRNTIPLYTDKSEIEGVLYNLRREGTLDVFDGEMFDEETRDSEIFDDEIENVREI